MFVDEFVRKAQEMELPVYELPVYDLSFGNQSHFLQSDEDMKWWRYIPIISNSSNVLQRAELCRAPLFSSLSLRNSRNSKPFCYELDGVALSPSKSTSSLVPLVPIETDFSPAELETIRWMMQKVSLRQDLDWRDDLDGLSGWWWESVPVKRTTKHCNTFEIFESCWIFQSQVMHLSCI